jgi:hypothetical protein
MLNNLLIYRNSKTCMVLAIMKLELRQTNPSNRQKIKPTEIERQCSSGPFQNAYCLLAMGEIE